MADLQSNEETEGRVLQVRALIANEQFDAAIADARAMAEQHRSQAIHEVRGLNLLETPSGRRDMGLCNCCVRGLRASNAMCWSRCAVRCLIGARAASMIHG